MNLSDAATWALFVIDRESEEDFSSDTMVFGMEASSISVPSLQISAEDVIRVRENPGLVLWIMSDGTVTSEGVDPDELLKAMWDTRPAALPVGLTGWTVSSLSTGFRWNCVYGKNSV